MKNNIWLTFIKKTFVLVMTAEIVIKHLIGWRVDDNLLVKYKNILPYIYYTKSMANKFVYDQTFLSVCVESAGKKSMKTLYKINPHKYWKMKPEA